MPWLRRSGCCFRAWWLLAWALCQAAPRTFSPLFPLLSPSVALSSLLCCLDPIMMWEQVVNDLPLAQFVSDEANEVEESMEREAALRSSQVWYQEAAPHPAPHPLVANAPLGMGLEGPCAWA
jgi:hypothetical protein